MRFVLFVAMLTVSSIAQGQERIAHLENSVRVEYQYVHTSDFEDNIGPFDIGETDTHALLLSGVYSINDRWKVFGSIPYVQRRQRGAAGVHDPVADFDQYEPPDLRFVDDGHYHSGFQDFYTGVQFLAFDSPRFSLSPYVSYGFPMTNYPIYGGAAIGKQLKELHLGLSMQLTPYFSDWFFQGDVNYAFSEQVLGVDLNYWLAYFSASYYLTPRFVPRFYVAGRNAPNGLTSPDDFPDWDTENGWRHDQTFKHSYVNAGIGFDYLLSERYAIAATLFKSIKLDNVAQVDYALTVGFVRRF